MPETPLRIGLIGAGGNMRARHIPGFRAQPAVEIDAVCNRRPASTAEAARDYDIPRTYERWQDLVAAPDIDAVVIGTWPYLHCPITLAALETGKHVLTEARMSLNAAEAHRMLAAARRLPHLITQIVPSPYGLKGHDVLAELIEAGFIGDLREAEVYSLTDALADPAAPLSWRQDAALSGYNMLTLGILHETLLRWLPPPVQVVGQVHAFVPTRIDPQSGVHRAVGTPDSVQVLAVLENGARVVYRISGVMPFTQGTGIVLYGTEGVIHYDLGSDRLWGASRRRIGEAGGSTTLQEIPIAPEKSRSWRVEQEFVEAIRGGPAVQFTDFPSGVRYMEFTEAVARSAQTGEAVELPLEEFLDDSEQTPAR
jgi:predicted dehydrogenase